MSDERSSSVKERIFLVFAAFILLIIAVLINANLGHSRDDSSKLTGTMDVDNGDLKINWERYQVYEFELSESLSITKSGVYHLTGSLENGLISINVRDGEVKLILDNVTIKNSDGPAIACYEADDLVIELVGESYIEDGKTYNGNYDEDVKGAIYSKADLTFNGNGALYLTANYQDGIVGKDDLKINGGDYNIAAADDGIRGKDSVYIVDGNFVIESTADAIKSTNETTAGKGFVLIEKGTLDITSEAKAIKATNIVLINAGDFTINSIDDAIHSDSYVGISGGNFTINSKDDGIHANTQLIIDGGNILIDKSYEGIEAQKITINDGYISIVSSDDGINAGGGADASATNRVGAGAFDTDEECSLSINGGEVNINASGDGLDSNGYIYINGGKTIVDGPTNNGNGALDAGLGIIMNGGEVFAAGSSGMAEGLGNSSTVYNISLYLSASQSAGTRVQIKNSSGETIIDYTPKKTFSHLAIGTEKFEMGEKYTIYLDQTQYTTFTISDITTMIGNTNSNQNMMMPAPRR